MPRPRPNGISTPMIELRSRARAPSQPMIAAAMSEPDDRAGDDVDADQQRRGGAGERELADAVHGEGHVALHHEDADEPADEAEDGAGDDGVRHQREDLAVVRRGRRTWRPRCRPSSRVRLVVLVVVVGLLGVGGADDDQPVARAQHEDGRAVQVGEHVGVEHLVRACRA